MQTLIDWAERRWLPDAMLRFGIRQLLRERLRNWEELRRASTRPQERDPPWLAQGAHETANAGVDPVERPVLPAKTPGAHSRAGSAPAFREASAPLDTFRIGAQEMMP